MVQKQYTYDPNTDSFTEVKVSRRRFAIKAGAYMASVLLMAFGLYVVFSFYLPSPKELSMQRKTEVLKSQYDELNLEVQHMHAVLDNIKKRDAEVYDLLLGEQPVDDFVWEGGIGGHDIEGEHITEDVRINALNNAVEDMERKLVLHSKYLDDVEAAAEENDLRRSNIPSIRPVQMFKSDSYVHLLSGFGMRVHPVHKVNKMHKGIDFPGKRGTPVLATGGGTIKAVKKVRSGYGRHVIIDHGFGYTSLYAHLDKIQVKKGQKVKRGEQIGTLGATGTVTAAHVHYEVRIDGRAVNPIEYCMDGLTPEEYELLVKQACEHNHSYD